uniref:Uncharacterized protein n=1 Tax=Arundo donax TaxID=35708 RepID=A0A0A8Y4J1_ARUDO
MRLDCPGIKNNQNQEYSLRTNS